MTNTGRTMLWTLFTAAIAATTLTVAAPASAAQAQVDRGPCKDYTSSDSARFRAPVALPGHPTGQEFVAKVTVAYPFCHYKKARDKASPRVVFAWWRVVDGRDANCRYFDGIRVNTYMHDQRGRNVNPGPFFVPCNSSRNENGNSKAIRNHEWLYVYDTGAPRFKAHVEAVYDLNRNDHMLVWDHLLPLPDTSPFRGRP